jgi:hypothetical protein
MITRGMLASALMVVAGVAHGQPRGERYVLPATPAPISHMPMQGGVEIGLGWRGGDDGLSPIAVSYGLFGRYFLGDDVSVGGRAAFLGADAGDGSREDAVRTTARSPPTR